MQFISTEENTQLYPLLCFTNVKVLNLGNSVKEYKTKVSIEPTVLT